MLDQEGLVDSFFIAAVQLACRPFGYELGREIVIGPNRQVCINDPEMSQQSMLELALALDDAVGACTT